jgi:hypothetical protein
MRQQPGDRKVMRDDDDRESEIADETTDKIEETRSSSSRMTLRSPGCCRIAFWS